MQLLIIIVASLIPGILWIRFFYLKDRFEQESLALMAKIFLLGAIAVGLAAAFQAPFQRVFIKEQSILHLAISSFLIIGLGEEFFKAMAAYIATFRSNEFNEQVDGIIYAVTAALGFSVVENILYTVAYGLDIAPIRAIIASLAHACFSGMFGVYYGRAKFGNHPRLDLIKGLAVAATIHGLYDFTLMANIYSPWLAIGIVAGVYFVLRELIEQALVNSPYA